MQQIYVILEIRKVLTKIGKESHCEDVNLWIRACENHLSWSATSTSSGDGNVVLAKFLSFLGHILDKHENLNDPLFNKCAHGESKLKSSVQVVHGTIILCIILHLSPVFDSAPQPCLTVPPPPQCMLEISKLIVIGYMGKAPVLVVKCCFTI